MTREEAIDLLDNLIGAVEDNHGSDYDGALKIAIKALEREPFINKPCVSTEACKYDKIKILDRLSDEIKGNLYVDSAIFTALYDFKDGKMNVDEVIDKFNRETITEVLKIIDKYRMNEEI